MLHLPWIVSRNPQRCDIANEAHKLCVKEQYGKSIKPRVFCKGELVLVYDQANDTLRAKKIVSMWHGPYIIKCVLSKGDYEWVDYDGNALNEP